MFLTLTGLNFGCITPTHAHPPAPLRSRAQALLSSRQPPRLTEGLSKILAEADVGELQHLAPFLTLAFPVSATTCRAHKIGTMSYEARTSDCSLALRGAERGATLRPFTRASPGKENKTKVVLPSPGWWNKRVRASDCQRKWTDQPLWLLNKVPTKNMKTFHLDISVNLYLRWENQRRGRSA